MDPTVATAWRAEAEAEAEGKGLLRRAYISIDGVEGLQKRKY